MCGSIAQVYVRRSGPSVRVAVHAVHQLGRRRSAEHNQLLGANRRGGGGGGRDWRVASILGGARGVHRRGRGWRHHWRERRRRRRQRGRLLARRFLRHRDSSHWQQRLQQRRLCKHLFDRGALATEKRGQRDGKVNATDARRKSHQQRGAERRAVASHDVSVAGHHEFPAPGRRGASAGVGRRARPRAGLVPRALPSSRARACARAGAVVRIKQQCRGAPEVPANV